MKDVGHLEATRTHYAIEIDPDDFQALVAHEEGVCFATLYDANKLLSQKLDNLPGVATNYNGHFGSAIYIQLDKEDDTPEAHEAIRDTIRLQIIEAYERK